MKEKGMRERGRVMTDEGKREIEREGSYERQMKERERESSYD